MDKYKPVIVDIDLSVKFRAFGITFGTLTQAWSIPVPNVMSTPDLHLHVLTFNQRGVRLQVRIRTAP